MTGELDKVLTTCEMWTQTYPHDRTARNRLAAAYNQLGQPARAFAELEKAREVGRDHTIDLDVWVATAMRLNRAHEARPVVQRLVEQTPDRLPLRRTAYRLHFVADDAKAMAAHIEWAARTPRAEALFAEQAATDAYLGRVQRSRSWLQRGVAAAVRNDFNRNAAVWTGVHAVREALLGNNEQARAQARAAVKLEESWETRALAALALARVGELDDARQLASRLSAERPRGTLVQHRSRRRTRYNPRHAPGANLMLTGTLGHYRIVRLLGRGGMGEVYLAEDTSLGRQVALKVLPIELAVPGRRERFEREARAIAALNHPNIVTLHSFEQAGDTPFLTMEYVDGKPLGEMIPAGGLPLDRLLKIAIPLADAVGAAHQRGILHRDLKPANVMVTGDGRIKVLDFGLAKLQDDLALGEALPTQELTGEGRIVGTVAYMSPEQAEGRVVDQRSDIFSIGVLLYELATGKRPFTGDTSLSVLSAILKETPRPVAELRPELPRDFARIVRRALNKDPEERYQSAKDLRNDLNAVVADLASGEIASAPAMALTPRRRNTAIAVTVTVLVALAVAAAGWLFVQSMSTAPASVRPAETWTPTRLTSSGLVGGLVAISPDGRYVAYATIGKGGQGVMLRQVATGSDVAVVPVDAMRIDGIAFSPDANFIYYSTYPAGNNFATLYRVPAIGGMPQRILRNLDTPIAFSPDGRRIAFVVDYPSEDRTTVELANADGSERRTLVERKRSGRFPVNVGRLAWSPDGSTIAAPVIDGAGQTLALIDAASGALRLLSDKRWPAVNAAQWLPGSRALMLAYRDAGASSTQLWRVDPQTGSGVAVTHDLFNYADLGVTSDGNVIVAAAALGESTLWMAAADRLGKPTQISTGAADGEGALGVAWTADSSIVYTSRASGNTDLWKLDPNTGGRQQLTVEPGDDRNPSISPDGRSIAFVSDRQGGSRIWVMHIDGSEPRAVSSGPGDILPVWTPDSASVIFLAANEPRRVNVNGSGERSLKAYWPARAGEAAKTFMPRAVSPQGLVAGFEEVDAQRGGGWKLAFAPLDASAPPTLLDFSAGTSLNPIAWAPDGKAIDIVVPQDVWNVWRYPIDGRRGFRVTTFDGPAVTRSFTWSANGQLLFSRGENKTDLVVFKRATGG